MSVDTGQEQRINPARFSCAGESAEKIPGGDSAEVVLALDTSQSLVCGGLRLAGGQVRKVAAHRAEHPREHAERIGEAFESVLAQLGCVPAAVNLMVVGVGPGGYTGLRAGIAAASAFALGSAAAISSVPSHSAIAYGYYKSGGHYDAAEKQLRAPVPEAPPVLVLTTGGRGQNYWSYFSRSGSPLLTPGEGPPSLDNEAPLGPALVDTADAEELILSFDAETRVLHGPVDPLALAALGYRLRSAEAALPPEPLYLRKPDITFPGDQAKGAGVLIRPAVLADIPALIRIERRAFPEDPWSLQSLLSELQHYRYFALEAEGHLVGYAGIALEPPAPGPESLRVAAIHTLAVLPSQQRRGWGRKLLQHLRAWARQQGATRMLLEVRVDNTAALSLYAAEGFQNGGRRKNYYGSVDAQIMELPLV